MIWCRRQRGEIPSVSHSRHRCAACGHDTYNVLSMPFGVHFNRASCRLVVTCPRCNFQWTRGCRDEVRVTLLLNEVEPEEETSE